MRVGRLVRVSSPSELASRRAGSMVTTQARRPSRAAWRAKAAAVVVLPTPPEPQQMTIDRSSTTSSMAAGLPPVVARRPRPGRGGRSTPAPRACAQGVELRRADGRGEQEGHPQLGEGQLAGQPFELLLLELLAGEPEPAGPVEGRDHPGIEGDPGRFCGRLAGGHGQSGHRAGSSR